MTAPSELPSKRRVVVYVDGFNFYFRRLRNTSYRWLNLQALFEMLLSQDDVCEIHYFIARVGGKFDAQKPIRQAAYLKALETCPKIQIHYGLFSTKIINYRLAEPLYTAQGVACDTAKVWRQDEKGSDVNLAVRLLDDAWRGRFDAAVILTNDSDLAAPMQAVRAKNLPVILIHPDSNTATSLTQAASQRIHLHDRHLREAQFPDQLVGLNGKTIFKPYGF